MSDAPIALTIWSPALAQGAHDLRLSPIERAAVAVLWQHLSPVEWLPMKAERAAKLLGVKRESAARVLRRLVETGYLLMRQPHANEPRVFLLVNAVSARAA